MASVAAIIRWLNQEQSDNPQLISYRSLRRAIGWMGFLLAPVLILGSRFLSDCQIVQPSLSHYYYTNMREIFVGTLCSVSLFLFSYKGYTRMDSYTSNIAGFFCLGVALFPTNVLCKISPGEVPAETCFACQQNVISITRIPYHATILHCF